MWSEPNAVFAELDVRNPAQPVRYTSEYGPARRPRA
jgi:hypothetical protein